jgi:nicotinamidase-related amidase
MPTKNRDLHGNVPDSGPVALLLIDVINDLEFPEGRQLLRHALPMVKRLVRLRDRARQAGIPVIYVNDNFGKWRSDFRRLLAHCLHDDVCGKPMVELIQPHEEDYFVLKPKHSGFFSTTLDTLLTYLHVRTLILTGIAGNICVLFTANDAFMRDFYIVVPADCVVSNTPKENRDALRLMKEVLKADITPSSRLNFRQIRRTVSQGA